MVRSQLNVSREYCPCAVCEQQRKDAIGGKKEDIRREAKDKKKAHAAKKPEKKVVASRAPIYPHVST